MLIHLFAFAANRNPQSGIEWQKAKKTWKSMRTRAWFVGIIFTHTFGYIWSPYIVHFMTHKLELVATCYDLYIYIYIRIHSVQFIHNYATCTVGHLRLNEEVNPDNQWAPNKNGEKPGRRCALNRGYALIKQMRLTTSRYGIADT